MLVTCYLFRSLSQSSYFHRHIRRVFADYGMPISLVAASAMAYWGRFNNADPATLPVGSAFRPVGDRSWLVRFWQLEGKWVGTAFPFGFALWVLFFFDHNVSVRTHASLMQISTVLYVHHQSLMAQGSQFPLRKPPGFHYDFFILGITTFLAGLLGVPAPNGLIPQAPIHTTSLLVMNSRSARTDLENGSRSRLSEEKSSNSVRSRSSPTHIPNFDLEPDPTRTRDGQGLARQHEIPVAVVEQRLSNLIQGSLCLVLLSAPFLHILNLIPRGVLAGLL